jgi:hypothetical protein
VLVCVDEMDPASLWEKLEIRGNDWPKRKVSRSSCGMSMVGFVGWR